MGSWESALTTGASKFPVPGPNVPIDIALNTLQSALNAAIESRRIKEDGQTKRAMLLVQQNIAIAQIKKDMQSDTEKHELRMKLVNSICDLLVQNARVLTPDIKESCQFLLMILRENS